MRTRDAPNRNWQIVWGVLLVISGILALLIPRMADSASAVVFGGALMFGGACELTYAVQTRQEPGFGWKLASGILTVVPGLAIVALPLSGISSLAVLLGALLFAGGITRTTWALRIKPQAGWGVILIHGLLSIAVAIIIASGWPDRSLQFIGLFTGFWLISAGICRVMLRRQTPA